MTGDDLGQHLPGTWFVLVVEDDPDTAAFTRAVLEKHAGMQVVVVGDADSALSALGSERFDLVMIDVELPGRSGLQILSEVHRLAVGVPIIVLTAHKRIEYAVDALRGEVDDFLVKPVDVAQLVERAGRLARRGREWRNAHRRKTVLAVGAHPDDVEIGVGGTLAAHASSGDRLVILTMSGGSVGGNAGARHQESEEAAAVVGAQLIHLSFEDTHLDPASGPITAVEKVIREFRPDQIYTHSNRDRHQDHRAVHQSVQVASRDVGDLACFQSPSSTTDFQPNLFVDIAEHLETKLRMLRAFSSQAHRDYMAQDLVRATARYWSRFTAGRYAEPLEAVRSTMRLVPSSGRFTGDGTADETTSDMAHDLGHG